MKKSKHSPMEIPRSYVSNPSNPLSISELFSSQNLSNNTLIINEEEENVLKIFIKRIPAAIAIFDKNLNYIITSDRWAEETNAQIKDVIGKNHYEVVNDIPLKWKKIHERCLNGEHLKCEEDSFKRSDGSIEWLRWEILPWYKNENNIGGIILFVEHITKRKILEKKMLGMIKALNKSNIELEKFAHICAHDLNEPLRTIANYNHILQEKFNKDINPEAKKYLDILSKSVKHMSILVNGILSYSQFGTSKLNKSLFSLEHTLNSVKMILWKKIKDKNAFIYSDKLPTVYGDITLITHVFQNLISNALKFNESDIPIIYVTVKEQKNRYIFTIEDNGIGIDAKYHKKIFELFVRLNPPSKYEGTGMGLSLSKKIIEAHGGRLWVKSSLNNGSQFLFTLPKLKL
ncbi:MAG: PAS domain S-box protein [Alphaproteobacteria bacterium]|nr:PAS domain S-box protein [Alphaproteobacteria bacterium]